LGEPAARLAGPPGEHRGELLYVVPCPHLRDRRRVGRPGLADQLADLLLTSAPAEPTQKIRSRVGPQFATTRRPTLQARSPPRVGPQFATAEGQTGASSGDHTQVRLCCTQRERNRAAASAYSQGTRSICSTITSCATLCRQPYIVQAVTVPAHSPTSSCRWCSVSCATLTEVTSPSVTVRMVVPDARSRT